MRNLTRTTGNVSFANGLEGVNALGVFLADLHNFSKGSFPNHFEQVERIDSQGLMPSGLVRDREVEGSRSGCCGVPLVGDMLQGHCE